jgi:hypothetical protein
MVNMDNLKRLGAFSQSDRFNTVGVLALANRSGRHVFSSFALSFTATDIPRLWLLNRR